MSQDVNMTTQPDSREVWIPVVGYGDRLRRIRLDLGMDQRTFADSIQMNSGTYGHHELSHHVRRGARQLANSIELRHGVPAWWVLGEDAPATVTRQEHVPHMAPVVSIRTGLGRRHSRAGFIPSQQSA